ncbi:MAG: hypothetical protein GVY25_11860 [Bacteroidetes bacterium]|jgi:hypothetical protein|nr:hypothetical protein [Bacteroidota bacterium]
MRAAAPAPLATTIEDEIPSIQQTTRIGQIRALVYTDREGISAEGL